jgi:hypothetical protein
MDWTEFRHEMDAYFRDIADPTDEELRAIENDPEILPDDDTFLDWLMEMLEETP